MMGSQCIICIHSWREDHFVVKVYLRSQIDHLTFDNLPRGMMRGRWVERENRTAWWWMMNVCRCMRDTRMPKGRFYSIQCCSLWFIFRFKLFIFREETEKIGKDDAQWTWYNVAPGFHELLHTSQAICSSYLLLHSSRITSGFPKMVVPNNHGVSY